MSFWRLLLRVLRMAPPPALMSSAAALLTSQAAMGQVSEVCVHGLQTYTKFVVHVLQGALTLFVRCSFVGITNHSASGHCRDGLQIHHQHNGGKRVHQAGCNRIQCQ